MKDERIYLTIHTTSPELLHAYSDSSNFIHYSHDSPFRQMMTVELLTDGIIFIFQNLQIFKFLHQPIPATLFSAKINNNWKNKNELVKPIILQCELLNLGLLNAITILTPYYNSIHPEIVIKLENNQILINFGKREMLDRYIWIIQGGLEQLKNMIPERFYDPV